MDNIRRKIESINNNNEKALTVFLTAGYPNPNSFVDLVLNLEKAGADIIEIGLPFGDSLADGPVIQASYMEALKNNINIEKALRYFAEIKQKSNISLVLMSSSNLILNYGIKSFTIDAKKYGVDGVIIPDVPLEEYDDFFENSFNEIDTILLTTPTSSEDRIKMIDQKSSGFVYCVSVIGTTGVRREYDSYVFENLKRTYNRVAKNKMQIGFGISSAENIKEFSPYCDGVIVGSAVIKSLANDDANFSNTINLVKELKDACRN